MIATPRLLRPVLDFCYPPVCASCQTVCEDAFLCEPCRRKLDELADAPGCSVCAMPLQSHGAPCPYCRGEGLPLLDRVVSLGTFTDPLRALIHQIKFHGRWTAAEQLGEELRHLSRVQALLNETDIIIPVPLHFLRHFARRYNQAEIIARCVRKKSPAKVILAARRVRNTETQTALHSRQRRVENLRDAFRLRRGGASAITAKRVLLVDDVMTTGATLQSLARTLGPARPASIRALVLAIADPRHRDFEAI